MKWIQRWYVASHTNPEKEYTVSFADDGETWGCSCPHWTRNFPRPLCKHIKEVQFINGSPIENIRIDEFFTEEEFEI